MQYAEITTAKDRVMFLREKLSEDARWAIRALMRIYAEQTQDEKWSRQTVDHNKVGFSGVDAEILSSFAEQVTERGRLTGKQMTLLHKKMPKYASQIERLTRKGA